MKTASNKPEDPEAAVPPVPEKQGYQDMALWEIVDPGAAQRASLRRAAGIAGS